MEHLQHISEDSESINPWQNLSATLDEVTQGTSTDASGDPT